VPLRFENPGITAEVPRDRCLTEFREADAECLEIGLVNNMPSQAMEATERQFRTLLDRASERMAVRLSCFALPDVPRSAEGLQRISSVYSRIDELWNGKLDGIIVTGAEPVTVDLAQEPFWGNLRTLMDWAEHNTHSSVWSCMAAHAAVLHVDGIKRQHLAKKLSGVFDSTSVPGNPLTAGLPAQVRIPHSRWNDIPEASLAGAGYRILLRSEQAGVDAFAKSRKSLFVLIQGHPEYEADTLLLEYRRDVRRFLRGQSETYPRMPRNCFEERDAALLTAMRERALKDRREALLADFPCASLAARVKNTWAPAAIRVYSNWLLHLREEKRKKLRSKRRQREYRLSTVKLGAVLTNLDARELQCGGEKPA